MPESNVVIDLSHHNQNLDFAGIASGGILGIIHKATQGTGYADPTCLPHKTSALANGLLWGAYHFGTGSDGVQQAEFFLSVVQPDAQTLLILDLEANGQGPSMTLEEARAFVTHVHDETGSWPGLYSGHYIKDLLGTNSDPALSNCWFWLSQYGPTAVVPPNWTDRTMWQYTDGAIGPQPHTVPGAGMCDRDKFNGDVAALRTLRHDHRPLLEQQDGRRLCQLGRSRPHAATRRRPRTRREAPSRRRHRRKVAHPQAARLNVAHVTRRPGHKSGPPSFCRHSTPPTSFRTEQADLFFRIRSCECVGPRREKSLCSFV